MIRIQPTPLRSAVVACLLLGQPLGAQLIGPSTLQAPYLLPADGLEDLVQTTALLTAGDSVGGYRLAGVGDGLGQHPVAKRNLHVLMNHEIDDDEGGVHATGEVGAFVSSWEIERKTLAVIRGEDQVPSAQAIHAWDPMAGTWVDGAVTFKRLCSADLARRKTYSWHGLGTKDRMMLTGEEARPPSTPGYGRAFAFVATGPDAREVWELPHLGRMSFENVVTSPFRQRLTVAVALDDASFMTTPTTATPSELYVYVGTKQKTGNPVQRAGLAGGRLHGVTVTVNGAPIAAEDSDFALGVDAGEFIGSGRFGLLDLGDASTMTGDDIQTASKAQGVLRFHRLEDGVWDPRKKHRRDFYFVTTGDPFTMSRLWRLRFDDIRKPELGGTIDVILAGGEGPVSMDNLTIDRRGRLLILEDPGLTNFLARVWLLHLGTGKLVHIASVNPEFFDPAGGSFLSINEESSGIVPVDRRTLGKDTFLLNVQAHFDNQDPELVEGGQLVLLHVAPKVGTGK